MSYPPHIQANVDDAERHGHKLVSQGCALFRCTRCNLHGYLDNDEPGSVFRRSCKAVHYRETSGNGYNPGVCGARGGRFADRHHKSDVTCFDCLERSLT